MFLHFYILKFYWEMGKSKTRNGQMSKNNGVKQVSLYLICIIISIFVCIPFLWMLFTSFKTDQEIYKFPITYLPGRITIVHYLNIFINGNLPLYLRNSLIVSIGAVILTLILAIFPAYAFARLRFRLKKYLLPTVIFCMVLPQIVLVIPFLQLLKSIKLTDTLIGLILVYLVVTTPASIWFLISFFDKIPKSLEQAAMIDGCNSVQTLFRVIVPIMKPGIAAVCIYSFFLAWNEFIFALSYLNSSNRLTLPIFLARFVGQYQTRWGDLFAGSVVAYVIPLIAFAVLQQQFISALVKGAVKE